MGPEMYSTIDEPSDRLTGFVCSVRREFASVGFRMYSGAQGNGEEFVPLGRCLLGRRGTRNYETFVGHTGSIVKKRRHAKYDATPLSQRYENVEIARDIIVEKLSLFKEGAKRTFGGGKNNLVVDEYFEEVDTIPMPQKT